MNAEEASGDPRFEKVVAAFLDAVQAGRRPDRTKLLARFPELADSLRTFFADHDRMEQIAKSPAIDATAASDEVLAELVVDLPGPGDEATLPPRPAGDVPTLPHANAAAYREVFSTARSDTIRYFGDYELLHEIARGGMGVVYQARQVNLNRTVALKMILSGQLASAEDVKRFYTEAEAAANLDHPGIVPIYEIGQHNGQHYFSMGFVEGESLAARITRGLLPPQEAADLVRRVAEAVHFAHERQVIHRDLKPANVLLDRSGNPKVTDFGLAKKLHGDSDLTGTGQALGTPSYMPPEQAAGKLDEIGPTADVYALGAILYCALVGRPPFQAANPMDTLLMVLDQEPMPPRKLNPTIPRDLETICLKCLEKKPAARYRSAHELAEDLQRFLDGDPIHARPLGLVGRVRRSLKRWPLASGCAMALAGLLIVAGGVGTAAWGFMVLGTVGFQLFEDYSTPAATLPLAVGGPQTTPVFHVAPDGMHEIRLRMQIQTSSYKEEMRGETPNIEPQYNFPIQFVLKDEAGNELANDSARAVWNSMSLRFQEGKAFDEQTGVVKFATYCTLCRFRGPAAGGVQAEVEVQPDRQYDAQLDELEVRVYENVRDSRGASLAGGALCCSSPLLLIAGISLLIYGPIIMAAARRAKAVHR